MPNGEERKGDASQPKPIDDLRWQLYNDHKKQAWGDIQSSTDSYDQSLLTLSSGGLGLSIAFIKDIVGLQNAVWLWSLYSSWIAFATCIFITVISFQFAIKTQKEHLVNCGKYYLECKEEYRDKRGGFSKALTACTMIAGGLFVLALVCTITFAIKNVEVQKMKKKPDATSIANDGRGPVGMTPLDMRELSEQRGRDAMAVTPIPPVEPSSAHAGAQSQAAKQSGDTVEKGRGAVPIVEIKPTQKPATTPERKK